MDYQWNVMSGEVLSEYQYLSSGLQQLLDVLMHFKVLGDIH
jgi:hypothetical protein